MTSSSRWRARPMPRSFAARSGQAYSPIGGAPSRRCCSPSRRSRSRPPTFYPYSSKYDAFLRGSASLSAAEQRGLAAFNDPARGNCARCHPSAMREGALPQFTDFGFAALGAPRNPAIPGECRSPLLRPRSVRSAAQGPYGTRGILRTVSHADSAQRRAQARRFCTTASSMRSRTWCASTPSATRLPKNGTRADANGAALKFDDLPARYREQCRSGSLPSVGTRASGRG